MQRSSLPEFLGKHVDAILSIGFDKNLKPATGKESLCFGLVYQVNKNAPNVPPRLGLSDACYDNKVADTETRTRAQLLLLAEVTKYLVENKISGDTISARTYYTDKSGTQAKNVISLHFSLEGVRNGGQTVVQAGPSIEEQLAVAFKAALGTPGFNIQEYTGLKTSGLGNAELLGWLQFKAGGAAPASGAATTTGSSVPNSGASSEGPAVGEENPLG